MQRMCCFAAAMMFLSAAAFSQVEYPDGGFEKHPRHDGPVRTGQGSGRCIFEKAPRYGFWQNQGVAVEPFALYRASIYIQGQRTAGGGNTIMTYHATPFGWDFVHGVQLPEKAEDWTRQEVDFYGPTDQARMVLIENSVGLTCQYYLDDLSITRLMTPAEHIATLEAKKERSVKENSLLAYYYHSTGKTEAWERLLADADAATKVAMLGLQAHQATTPAEVSQRLGELLKLNPFANYRGGGNLVKALLARLPASEQERVCLEAVLTTRGTGGTVNALALTPLDRAAKTLQQRQQAVEQGEARRAHPQDVSDRHGRRRQHEKQLLAEDVGGEDQEQEGSRQEREEVTIKRPVAQPASLLVRPASAVFTGSVKPGFSSGPRPA